MATLTPVAVSLSGVDVAGVTPTASTGDVFANTGKEIVEIKNASGSPITVTLDHLNSPDGAVITDPTVTVADGITKAIGPFPPGYYNNGSGQVKVTCSAVTSVTIKVLQVTPV